MSGLTGAKAILWMAAMTAGLALAVPPPPPPGDGGIKPPDAPPPGKIFFEDHVVIVGPGFVKPETGGGTLFIDLTRITPDKVDPDKDDTTKTIKRVVSELTQVKTQVESETGAIPRGLLDPASLLALLGEDDLAAGRGVFDDPAFLHEETGAGEAAAPDRTEQARSGGASVKTAPDAPAPSPAARKERGAPVTPSYWQLPLR